MKARKSRNSTNPKRTLGYRAGRKLRSAGEFGRDAVTNPRALPNKAHGLFRRWFRKIWTVRGGGLYALGYAVTFLFWEIRTLTGDIAGSTGVGDFVSEQITEHMIQFVGDTISNMVHAFIWPVYVVQLHPMYGGIALGLGFILFPKFLKKPIEHWIFADAEQGPPPRQ